MPVDDTVNRILDELRKQGVSVTSLCTDSRCVAPGDVFLAYPGGRADGRRHIGASIARGASAVLWERDGFDWDSGWTVPNVSVTGLRAVAGHVAHVVYGKPSERLWIAGVTGTNGKTSVSQWIAQAFSFLGRRCGVIGTLGTGYPGALQASINTTPDAVELQKVLAKFVSDRVDAVAMEASSIGLHQGRVNGVRFATAAYTNLSRDHLDYHGNMEEYAAAKRRLFFTPGLSSSVLNLDDVQGVAIAGELAGTSVQRIGYSLYAGGAERAGVDRYLEAREITLSMGGASFLMSGSWGEARIETAVVGRYNVANLLAVAGVLLSAGVSLEGVVQALRAVRPVAGRMERHGGDDQPLVVVDYAHTPDALEKVLVALSDIARNTGGRLVCVFGCGGDRDRGKRPLMAAVACRYSDHIVITSDNPRAEDPRAIVDEILHGVDRSSGIPLDVISDRSVAIGHAVRLAGARDIVLLAGKGHEDYQEIGGRKLPFSDSAEAERALGEFKS